MFLDEYIDNIKFPNERKKKDIDWRVLHRYSFLRHPKINICMLDLIPIGWVENFGEEMCEELLKLHTYFRITEIRMENNGLIIETDISDKNLNQVLKKYENLSKTVCMICGKEKPAEAIACKECIKYEK